MGIDRPGADTDVEQVEDKPVDNRPAPPVDRPGQEPEDVPSRLETRRAIAAVNEKTAEATDKNILESTRDGSAPTSEVKDGSALAARGKLQSDLDAETSGKERTDSLGGVAQESPGERRDNLRDDPVDAGLEGKARESDGQTASKPDAEAEQQPKERTDKPYEVKAPQIVRDYYTNIPPTEQDRYLVRDQANPVPVFDGSPNRNQAVQGRVGDCGIVATLGSVAEHRPGAIKDAVKQVGDGEYEITLHDVTEATPADPVARPTGDTRTYLVNDELPVRTDVSTPQLAGARADSCGWSALMEKVIAAEDQTWDTAKKADWDQAWAAWHKPAVDQDRANAGLEPSPNDAPMGYNRIDIGSTAYQRADLLAKLTGEDAEVRPIPGERQGEKALLDGFQDQLDAGKPILVGTRGRRYLTEDLPDGINAGHAYEVTKVENDKIHLRNPWGYGHPDPMNAETFLEYYRGYNRDGTRDGHYTTLK